MPAYRRKAFTLLFITAIIWGIAGPVIKYTLGGIGPLDFLVYRFFLSSLPALYSIFKFRNSFPKDKKTIIELVLFCVLSSSFSLGFLFLGMNETTVLESSLIATIGPLLVTVAGAYFLKENITRKEKIGIAIAVSGTMLTIIEPILKNGAGVRGLTGNLLIVLYLLGITVSAVFLKDLLRKGFHPFFLADLSFLIGFLNLFPFVIAKSGINGFIQTIIHLPLPYQIGVFFMAFVSGNIAYAIGNKAQKSIEISEAGLFTYLATIFSAPLAIFWLKEKITPLFLLGALIIAVGVFTAEFKIKKLWT